MVKHGITWYNMVWHGLTRYNMVLTDLKKINTKSAGCLSRLDVRRLDVFRLDVNRLDVRKSLKPSYRWKNAGNDLDHGYIYY